MKALRRLLKEEKGGVLALVSVLMLVILGIGGGVMDVGLAYETRRQLQNGVDGAALAGAWELARLDLPAYERQARAINAALDYAQRNGIPLSQIAPGYPLVTSEGPYTQNAMVVAATRPVNTLVAKLFNQGVWQVGTQATAVVGPVVPTEGLWPWGVPQNEIVPGRRIDLKVGAPPGQPGNFRPLDFPPLGGGANSYLDGIKYGYGRNPGDYINATMPWDVPVQTGNVVGPTQQGIRYLEEIAAANGQNDPLSYWNTSVGSCTWAGAPISPSDPDNPPPAGWIANTSSCNRIGIVPILQSFDVNGRGEVTIVGWGAFYLIGYSNAPGGLMQVSGYFASTAVVHGGRFNWGAPLSGLIGVQLWR